jgi:hypothetical protein
VIIVFYPLRWTLKVAKQQRENSGHNSEITAADQRHNSLFSAPERWPWRAGPLERRL